MKCKVVQRRLLSLTHPERVPTNLRGHLVRCAACREWHSHLILLERHVPLLPIPTSKGKASFLRRLVTENAATADVASVSTLTLANAATTSEKRCQDPFPAPAGRQKRVLTPFFVGVAAALVLIAIGWLGLQSWLERTPPVGKPVPDALLASLVQRDLRLARASTPRERIEILAAVADDLHGETNALAHAGCEEELTALAKLYDAVVRQGILKQAEALSPADRDRALVTISFRMAETASRVEELAQELPREFAKPLLAIAATARAACAQLRTLTTGNV